MDSIYLVWFSPNDPLAPALCLNVSARTFIHVEDWAFNQHPDGYFVTSIEKHYGSPTALNIIGGDVNVYLSDEGEVDEMIVSQMRHSTRVDHYDPPMASAAAIRASIERAF